MVEPPAHNRPVVGSTPAGRTNIKARIHAFKEAHPEPTWNDLQNFAFGFGRFPDGDKQGLAMLKRDSKKLQATFPAFDFYPMNEWPDTSVISICVDDPRTWE